MIIIKALGLLVVVTVCSLLGFLMGQSIKERAKKLSAFCDGLNMLYEYIEQGELVLDKAVKKAFGKYDFFIDTDLKNEDKALIKEFFSSLGHSSKKNDCERIKLFTVAMQKKLKEAETEVAQKCKIYSTFGICIGLGLAVLLV